MMNLSGSKIFAGDALDLFAQIPDNSVQLCVTSPPYNIGKSYEKDDPKKFSEYSAWLKEILQQVERTLVDGGSLCLQLGSHVRDGILVPLDYEFYPFLIEIGLTFRNRIIWRYNFGYNAVKRLSGRYEVILWFTKGGEYKFNLDPIRVKQLYPGKRHSASKGDKAGKPSGNPRGKNPSDYWEFDPESAFFGEPVWNIPNVKANHPEKVADHPCQFPSELVERCVLAMTDSGDVVLDPFVGTGTSVICADLHNRVGLGFEIIDGYAADANRRLELAREGRLILRRSGMEPRTPKPGERVSTLPEEWRQDMEGDLGAGNEEIGKETTEA
ncbi:site-specific DNA-methyltransferase [Citromicrobium bathyomarinum]|uniref:DNA-methyltransferase n=1 Tax=Citromicrobium bathyomarinum TaxID=72174 RepID=UPI003159DEAB